jgi:hypothetical protein
MIYSHQLRWLFFICASIVVDRCAAHLEWYWKMEMNKRSYWLMICLLIIMAAPMRSRAQEVAEEPLEPLEPLESLWINLPSSPLRFFPNPEGNGYSLNNYSIGYIVQYRLGCVQEQGNGFKILSKRGPKEISLRPMTSSEVHARAVIALTGPALDACKRGKLTVIEVQFKDGAVWKIK